MSDEVTPGSGIAITDYSPAILEALRIANIGVVVTLDIENIPRCVHVSDVAEKIIGRPREVILSTPLFDFFSDTERQRMSEIRERRTRGEGIDMVIDTEIMRENEPPLPVSYVVARHTILGAPGFIAFVWDISSRRAEEARHRSVIEGAPDGIVISRNGIVLEANRAAATMLGFDSPKALAGFSLFQLLTPADAAVMVQRVQAGRNGAVLTPRTYHVRKQDGSRLIAEITSVPYDREDGPAVLGFARDITDRARLEAQLLQNERLASVGTLAAGIAHEVNNPLAFMSLNLEALASRVDKLAAVSSVEKDAMAQIITDLRGGVDRVAGIVRELRFFSRGDAEHTGPTDALESLRVAARMTAHEVRYRARFDAVYGEVPLVRGHAKRLEQVFVNLLLNAVHALPDGRPENRIDVRSRVAEDGRVVIEIEDNGLGMSPDVLRRVFDPFFTTKPPGEGTGIGLSISHGIVSQMGGEIEIDSEEGRGTIARVYLVRASENDLPESVVMSAQPAKKVSRARVLIVDDEPNLTASLSMLISDEHEVSAVNSGDAACAALLNGGVFDVVLCDITMPGMSGMDVYSRVADGRPDLLSRFVFMTGGACSTRAADFLARVPNRVLEKPFTFQAVTGVISEVVGRAS